MAWTNSKVFTIFELDSKGNTTAYDLDADTPKLAWFDTSVTPDQTVTAANSAYAAGVWAAGGVSDASGWPAAGRPLVSATWARASNVVTYDAADTASANSTTTLTAFFGGLLYDDTLTTPVADQGLCYLYAGGSQTITSGLLTAIYAAGGIMAFTL